MKPWLIALPLMVLVVSLTGCEHGWTTGGGVQDWNSAYNWVNFSGTYKGADNGILITAYTATSGKTNSVVEIVGNTGGGSGGSDGDTDAAKSESFSIADNTTVANATLRYTPIVAGSVRVVAGTLTLVDNGSGTLSGGTGTGTINYNNGALSLNFGGIYPGSSFTVSYIQSAPASSSGTTNFVAAGVLSSTPVLAGSLTIAVGSSYSVRDNGSGGLSGSGLTGSIDYSTGAWTIDFYGNTVPQNTDIVASYNTYSTGTEANDKSGTTGKTIYSFVVAQEGENLAITDNNGCSYQGSMGSIRTTSGGTQTTPIAGDVIVAQFTASGVSAAGLTVTIAGNFQGVVAAGTADFSLTSRQMLGTWIEDGGQTGDVKGTAPSVAISYDSSATTTDTSSTTTTSN